MYGIDTCVELAYILEGEEIEKEIMPVLNSLLEEKSWRLRYLVVDKIVLLAEAVGKANATKLLLPLYFKLL